MRLTAAPVGDEYLPAGGLTRAHGVVEVEGELTNDDTVRSQDLSSEKIRSLNYLDMDVKIKRKGNNTLNCSMSAELKILQFTSSVFFVEPLMTIAMNVSFCFQRKEFQFTLSSTR